MRELFVTEPREAEQSLQIDELPGRRLAAKLADFVGRYLAEDRRVGAELGDHQVSPVLEKVATESFEIAARLVNPIDDLERRLGIASEHRVGRGEERLAVGDTEDLADLRVVDRSFRKGDHALEQRFGVAHAALPFAGDRVERAVREIDLLLRGDARELVLDSRERDALEIVTLAARHDRLRE